MKEPIHRHHIIPRHMGGTDDPENIIELTVTEHAKAHQKLYETYGKYEDLCAYLMLSGKNKDPEFIRARAILAGTASRKKRLERGLTGSELFYGREVTPEEIKINSAKGGKIQGPANAESGHIQQIQKLSDCSAAGKKGGAATMLSGKGAFGNPQERLESCRKGGKVQGKRNAESGHLKKIAQLSKRSKGKVWITNGKENKMIDPSKEFPEGFHRGKVQKQK
jgi:hypothetical protein